jgi:hypothetical protein
MPNDNKVEIVIQGTDQTGAATRSANSNLDRIAKVAKTAAASLATLWAAKQMANFAKGIIDLADETGKLAQKVGASTEFMSAMNHAAEMNEVSSQQLKISFKELNEQISEGSQILRGLGIATRDAAGNILRIDDVLPQVADRFADMADGAQKSELATKLFGRAGIDMIPMLNQGSAGLKQMSEEARTLGLIIGNETAQQADEFNDNLTRLKAAGTGLGLALAKDLLPELVRFSEVLLNIAQQKAPIDALFIALNNGIASKSELWRKATQELVNAFTAFRLGMMGIDINDPEIKKQIEAEDMPDEDAGRFNPDGSINIRSSGTRVEDLTEFWKMYDRLRMESLTGDENATARAEEIERQHHEANLARIEEIAKSELDQHMLTEAEFSRHAAVMEQQEREAGERRRMLHIKVANGVSDTFGNMAQAALAFGKKGFKAWKAFATAQAIVNTYSSAVGAYNAMVSIPYIGPALAVAAAAAAVAAGLANVAVIQRTEPSGAAHGGMSYVPSDSTYQVQAGERILSPRQNADITDFLQNGGSRGRSMQVDIYLDGAILARGIGDMSRDGRLEIDARAVV